MESKMTTNIMGTSYGHDESPRMNITKKKTLRAKIPDVTKKIKNH